MPAGSEVVVISSAAGLIVIASSCEALAPPASVTRAVKRHVPAVVGEPAIVAPLSDSPGGSVPLIVHLYGEAPPVAVSVCEYAAPTAPGGSDPVVMASAAATETVNGCVSSSCSLSLTRTVKE